MQYCTNRKCTSGKSIGKDQRTSQSLSDSWGSVKHISMEHMAGRVPADQSTKRFEAMSRVVGLIASQTYQGKLAAQLLWHSSR